MMEMMKIALLALLALQCTYASASFVGQVNVLTDSTFDSSLETKDEKVAMWILDFYAPW